MMAALRILAVAVASGRIGYAFFVGENLRDWKVSNKAAKSPTKAAGVMQSWINELKPEVVVTEKQTSSSRKSDHSRALISAISHTASHNYLLDVATAHEHEFDNKYQEAEAISKQFPELEPWLPERRHFYDNEPHNTVIFEAVSLALSVLRGPTSQLAAAMG